MNPKLEPVLIRITSTILNDGETGRQMQDGQKIIVELVSLNEVSYFHINSYLPIYRSVRWLFKRMKTQASSALLIPTLDTVTKFVIMII